MCIILLKSAESEREVADEHNFPLHRYVVCFAWVRKITFCFLLAYKSHFLNAEAALFL